MEATSGHYSPTGPHCMIKQIGGACDGRCIYIDGGRVEPGGYLTVFPCLNQWSQMFSFGDGIITRTNATIFGSVPMHFINALKYEGIVQPPHLCFGVTGRGKHEYTPWKEDRNKDQLTSIDFIPHEAMNEVNNGDRLLPLRLWKHKQLVTIPCSNEDAIVDFVTMPFIVEE